MMWTFPIPLCSEIHTPGVALRATPPLATRFIVCQAADTHHGQARRPARTGRHVWGRAKASADCHAPARGLTFPSRLLFVLTLGIARGALTRRLSRFPGEVCSHRTHVRTSKAGSLAALLHLKCVFRSQHGPDSIPLAQHSGLYSCIDIKADPRLACQNANLPQSPAHRRIEGGPWRDAAGQDLLVRPSRPHSTNVPLREGSQRARWRAWATA
jgi:hypothetical protein